MIWALVALAGAYPATALPLWIGALVLGTAERPRLFRTFALLDAALLVLLAAVAVQLLPVGASVVHAVDPAAPRLLDRLVLESGPAAPVSVSIDRAGTAAALLGLAGVLALFWVCRDLFARRGVRLMARAIAGLGLVVSIAAIVQRTSAVHRMYGLIAPVDPMTTPFGPFVNRDHFATWIVMAIPLTIGCLLAHVNARPREAHRSRVWTVRVARALGDADRLWLSAAVAVMAVALVASTSRSGIVGLFAALVAGTAISSRRPDTFDRRWIVAGGGAVLLVVVAYANVGRVAARFAATLTDTGGHRLAIWHDSWRIAHDFWLTGTGAGTFQRAMLVYQTSDRQLFFNQAHNHYLQLVTEGGLLLAVPALAALVTLVARIRRALILDRSPRFWLRAGAAAGLCGVAVQSLWETGLRMPANAVLCAVLAAIALHERSSTPADPSGNPHRQSAQVQPRQ